MARATDIARFANGTPEKTMADRWKGFLLRLPALAIHCAALLARHPLERWSSMVDEARNRR